VIVGRVLYVMVQNYYMFFWFIVGSLLLFIGFILFTFLYFSSYNNINKVYLLANGAYHFMKSLDNKDKYCKD
jgi:hypothetical protein